MASQVVEKTMEERAAREEGHIDIKPCSEEKVMELHNEGEEPQESKLEGAMLAGARIDVKLSRSKESVMDIRNEGEEAQALQLAGEMLPRAIDVRSFSARLKVPAARARFSLLMWNEQMEKAITVLLPARTWCGVPTNNTCGMCEATGKDPAMAICIDSCLGRVSNHCKLCFEKLAEVRLLQ